MARHKDGLSEKERTARLPSVRCTQEELETVRQKAAQAAMSQSDYLRIMATKGRITVRQSKTDVSVVMQLQRIGVNLNQIVRLMHIRGGAVPLELSAILQDVQTVLDRLMEV